MKPCDLTHRTVVIKPLPAYGDWRDGFLDVVATAWDKVPPRLRRFAAWWIQPRVLVTLSAIAICFLGIGIHYYTVFSAEIDARLTRDVFDNSARIVASPINVNLGDQFSMEELASYLDAAGYSPSSGEEPAAQGSYSVGHGTIDVTPTAYGSSRLGLLPTRIEIDSRRRVSSLIELK